MPVSVRTVSVYDFKAHLSGILAQVEQTGEDVVVTRHGKPVARVGPAAASGQPRPVGMWRGRMSLPDGWEEFTEQDEADWYGA
jgi:prevent-host-death family protein